MMDENDKIPIVEIYRGVGIHDQQPRARIDGVVKPEIDQVMGMADVTELAAWAATITKAPESRLLAAAKVFATHEVAANERRVRPDVDLANVKASVAGLNSRRRRSPTHYASALDVPASPGQPGPAPRSSVAAVARAHRARPTLLIKKGHFPGRW